MALTTPSNTPFKKLAASDRTRRHDDDAADDRPDVKRARLEELKDQGSKKLNHASIASEGTEPKIDLNANQTPNHASIASEGAQPKIDLNFKQKADHASIATEGSKRKTETNPKQTLKRASTTTGAAKAKTGTASKRSANGDTLKRGASADIRSYFSRNVSSEGKNAVKDDVASKSTAEIDSKSFAKSDVFGNVSSEGKNAVKTDVASKSSVKNDISSKSTTEHDGSSNVSTEVKNAVKSDVSRKSTVQHAVPIPQSPAASSSSAAPTKRARAKGVLSSDSEGEALIVKKKPKHKKDSSSLAQSSHQPLHASPSVKASSVRHELATPPPALQANDSAAKDKKKSAKVSTTATKSSRAQEQKMAKAACAKDETSAVEQETLEQEQAEPPVALARTILEQLRELAEGDIAPTEEEAAIHLKLTQLGKQLSKAVLPYAQSQLVLDVARKYKDAYFKKHLPKNPTKAFLVSSVSIGCMPLFLGKVAKGKIVDAKLGRAGNCAFILFTRDTSRCFDDRLISAARLEHGDMLRFHYPKNGLDFTQGAAEIVIKLTLADDVPRLKLEMSKPAKTPKLNVIRLKAAAQKLEEVKASLWWDEAEGGPFCDDEDEQQGWMRLINSLSLPSRSSLCLGHQ